jgi:predicted DNA-binding protein with PD1-like motif
MRSVSIGERGETHVLIFDKGDEVMEVMRSFATEQQLTAGHFTAIGAFHTVTIGFFQRDRKDYKKITIDEEVEVMSLVGNIILADDGPRVHAHVVVGKADGTAHGGHLLGARVWPTLEVILVESPEHLQRKIDEETGLALISL